MRTLLILSLVLAIIGFTHGFLFGVNMHPQQLSTWDTVNQVGTILKSRNIRSIRIDLSYTMNITYWRGVANIFKSYNVNIEAMLYAPTTATTCGQQVSEGTAYNATYGFVNQMKDLISDWEVQNERQLFLTSTGYLFSDFNTSCGVLEAAVHRGMSRAIKDVSKASGIPLRVILGFVSRGYGFLDFMISQNVTFDVIGYHIYPYLYQTNFADDTWFGTGGLFTQVQKYGKPMHINEFNCAEIYNSTYYGNQPGVYQFENCLLSIKKHLTGIVNQNKTTLESVSWYELLDQPELSSPSESKFGIMYNLTSPKIQLYLASAFAGGQLTAAERFQVTNRSLFTDAQINYIQQTGTPTPTPTPTTTTTTAAPVPTPTPSTSSTITPAPTGAATTEKISLLVFITTIVLCMVIN